MNLFIFLRCRFRCDECDYFSVTSTGIRLHKECHTAVPEEYTCDLCPRKFTKKTTLAIHIKDHSKLFARISQTFFLTKQARRQSLESTQANIAEKGLDIVSPVSKLS